MKCMYCAHKKTDIINSREVKHGEAVWRRRKCLKCDTVFTTREIVLADNIFVLKKKGKRERFVYEKLFISIFNILHTKRNTDNGINAKLAKRITEDVIAKIVTELSGNKNISTKSIIMCTIKILKKYGQAYASQYANYSEYRTQIAVKEKLLKIE